MNSRLERIAWQDLPRTFRDAIYVTRQLGYSYLWIDSFCIIQDDQKDWIEEAVRMFEIYSSAVLVLAAHHAKNSQGGLFTRVGKSREVRLALPSSSFESKHMRDLPALIDMIGHRSDAVCPLINTGEETTTNEVKTTYEVAPLFTRAWVFQERMMSRRMLIFTASEMVWQCNDDISCRTRSGVDNESFRALFQAVMAGRKPDVWEYGPSHVGFKSRLPRLGSRLQFDMETKQNIWYMAVERYSDLSITKPDDKLPAIAAIARKLKQFMRPEDQYLAGLWSESFYEDLLWRVRPGRLHDNARGIDRILSARPHHPSGGSEPCWPAPTWSWASVQDPVSFMIHRYKRVGHEAKLHPQCSIEKFTTCNPDQDQFMLPARNLCKLPMEARTVPARLRKLEDGKGRIFFQIGLTMIDGECIHIHQHRHGCRVHVDADPWPKSGWEAVDPTHFYGGDGGGRDDDLDEERIQRQNKDYDSDADSSDYSAEDVSLSGYDSENILDLPRPRHRSKTKTKHHWCKPVQLAEVAYVTGVTDDSTSRNNRHADRRKRYIFMILQQDGPYFARLGLARVDELDSTVRLFAKLKRIQQTKRLVIV
ncbi:hypothetical protein PFICI_12142 [Pestalotiopsis fici W106-1]|uniref:Heterokaryon incompatibility domain-containing protein n=1 Tax=Pestalotiopsis fici (strain W106-1 / CGMCC3.15140) TaxID=1229662 RepID=W3WSC6_PESFW|nr:uncharacterized protein PFICI_12142 [Pestalotiopsis fici W106-1]ETS76755.1 hypothetical protein PFICI_12142 [Pestalotiopsis fici W106-1]